MATSPIISNLKLSAGWGQTGNQEIPSKITQPLFTAVVSGTPSYPLDDSDAYPADRSQTQEEWRCSKKSV